MSDERDGIEMLRKAIDDVAERLPAPSPGRRVSAVSWAVVAACVIAAAAVATYRLVLRPAGPVAPADAITQAAPPTPAAPPSLGVEVKLLRVRGRDVGARVFDAARAGTVVVAPAIERKEVARPVGAVVLPEGGVR